MTLTSQTIKDAVNLIGQPPVKIERGRLEDIGPQARIYRIDGSLEAGYTHTVMAFDRHNNLQCMFHIKIEDERR